VRWMTVLKSLPLRGRSHPKGLGVFYFWVCRYLEKGVQMKTMLGVVPMTVGILGFTTTVFASAGGSHHDLLVKARMANATGECPASFMAADVKARCDQQLPTFLDALTSLGPIRMTSFQSMRTLESPTAQGPIPGVGLATGDRQPQR
jgi:hypothetical protein